METNQPEEHVSEEPQNVSSDEPIIVDVHPRILEIQGKGRLSPKKLLPRSERRLIRFPENATSDDEDEGPEYCNVSELYENIVSASDFLEHDLPMIPSPFRKDIESSSLDEIIQSRPNIVGPSGGMKRKFVPSTLASSEMSLAQIIAAKKESKDSSFIALEEKLNTKKDKQAEEKNSVDIDMEDESYKEAVFAMPRISRIKRSRDSTYVGDQRAQKELKYTPQSCIRILALKGYVFEYEAYEMIDEDHAQYSKRRWRVQVYEWRETGGQFVGIGEAPRKALARESAILNWAEQLRASRPDICNYRCEIPNGARIRPYVLRALDELCERNGLDKPAFNENLVTIKGREKYQYTVFVGSEQYTDTSFDFKLAKLSAAKKAYDAMSPTPFRYDDIIQGKACLDEKEFSLISTEELHVVNASTPPPQRELVWESCMSSAGPSGTTTPVLNGGNDRDTPLSFTSSASFRRVDIATVSAPETPPILATIRQRIQEKIKEQEAMKELFGPDGMGGGFPVVLGVETGVSSNPFRVPQA